MTVSPFSYGNVLTPGQWAYLFGQKQNALGYTPVNRAGDTMLGPLATAPSTSNGAGFSIPPGAAPAQPVDGQVWMTIVGLFAQVGGKTIGPIANGNVVGPSTSVVGDIPIFSATDGTAVGDSGVSLGSQPANQVLATPGSGAGAPAFRALVGADLPAPQVSALGGVKSAAAPAHLFGTGIDTSGNPTFGQPAIGDISGLATNMAAFLIGGTSATLAAAVSDETGSGPLVFATNPTVALGSASTAVTQTPADNSNKVATTAYVQAAIFATTTLPACKLATTAALPTVVYANGASGVGATLTASANGALTVDGVAASVNDVILVKNQASTFQNGIYTVTAAGSAGAPFVLTRAPYYNLAADINLGDQTFITGGATFGTTTWAQNGTENPVIGTNPITFAQTAGLGTNTAGNGLSLVGTQFSIDTGITVDKTTAQSLSNKTLTQPVITLKQSAAPTPTAEGDIQWDTDDNILLIGDGAAAQTFVPFPPSVVAGDLFYATSAKALTRIPKGTALQVLRMNAGDSAPEWGDRITLGAAVATTSGTLFDWTGLPANTKRVTMNFKGVSNNTAGQIICAQLGTSGGVVTSGYLGTAYSTAPAATNSTSGAYFAQGNAIADLANGSAVFSLLDPATNTWSWTLLSGLSNASAVTLSAGAVVLPGTLDRIRLTSVGGTATFDAGIANVSWE